MKSSLARLFAFLALLCSPCFAIDASVPTNKPNIIFILADDLGYGDLGCYGQKKIQTPQLDRMAAEGMRFTQAYAGSTVCAPSRCVLMTGMDTGHARVRGNDPVPLRPQDVTVAKLLQDTGYATGLIGKWGLGEAGTTGIPTKQGFDYFFGYLNQVHAHNYYPAFLWRNDERVSLANKVPPGKIFGHLEEFGQGWATKKVEYSHDLFAEDALRWIEQNKGGPFFLYLAFTIPHENGEAAHPTGNPFEVPDLGIYQDKDWSLPARTYSATITRMDADIGRLLALLKNLGLDDNTLVVFSSDNGPEKRVPALFASGGSLRGIKRDLYEGGIRVPMMARWPGKIKAGAVSDQVVAFCDFLPTVAALAGVKPPSNITGISMLPALLGQPQKQHEYLYWEFHEGPQTKQAIRFGDWKAVRLGGPGKPIELYDLKTDSGEQRNIASIHPDLIAKAETILNGARTANPIWPIKTGPKAKAGK